MLSIKHAEDDLYKSTYNLWFDKTAEDLRPKKIYKQYPSYCDDQTNLAATKRVDAIIPSKKRIRPLHYKKFFPTCLGLGCYGYVPLFNTDKPIVRDVPPQQVSNELKPKPEIQRLKKPQNELTLDEMLLNSKWVSTKTKEEKDYHLPIPTFDIPKTTLEENSDMVRYRTQRREDHVGDWQKAGWSWDRMQLRDPCYYDKADCLKKIDQVQLRKEKVASRNRKPRSLVPEDQAPFAMSLRCKERQLPGYYGYVPMEPVECTYDKDRDVIFQTSFTSDYSLRE